MSAGTSKVPRHRRSVAVADDPVADAREADLRYVCDARPGISRLRRGRGFEYRDARGQPLEDADTRARIRALAIPPAWTDVWICPDPRGHLQATGRDARGRKQYRYHPRWREVRDANKYERMVPFGRALPRIRARAERDLARPGLPREKVLAAVVQLLDTTLIRVGNDGYARDNGSYGLTTMRRRHATVVGSTIEFRFRGKSGKRHRVVVHDRRLARVVKRCHELPGQELFGYLGDDDEPHDVGSTDVNEYLREISGKDFTAKDFRTWAGTVSMACALGEFDAIDSVAEGKRNIVRAIEQVADTLGNTPAVCRRCYVHPAVLEGYLDGSMRRALRRTGPHGGSRHALRPEESAVLDLLRKGQGNGR